MNRLLEIGFEPAGRWQLEGGRLECKLTRHATRGNILYAFVCDGEVLYVGKTIGKLSGRMAGYRRPHASQATNVRNNKAIRALVDAGSVVDILALPDSGLMHYGKFHLNLAAGLEDSIIRNLQPPWNGGKTEPVAEQLIAASDAEDSTEQEQSLELAAAPTASFDFSLAPTYRKLGFFNVPAASQALLGADGETIELFLGEAAQPVLGFINRKANANGSPRLMGGAALRMWFSTETAKTLRVDVLSPTAIRIRTERVETP